MKLSDRKCRINTRQQSIPRLSRCCLKLKKLDIVEKERLDQWRTINTDHRMSKCPSWCPGMTGSIIARHGVAMVTERVVTYLRSWSKELGVNGKRHDIGDRIAANEQREADQKLVELNNWSVEAPVVFEWTSSSRRIGVGWNYGRCVVDWH